MENELLRNMIWTMVAVLSVLIIIRIVLVRKGKFVQLSSHGVAQSCGTRDVQEDTHFIYQTKRGTLAALIDGTGRNQNGAMASVLIAETVLEVFEGEDAFRNPNYFFQKTLRRANRRVLEHLDESSGGASAALILLEGHTLYYAVAGNVKVAVFRQDELIPITEGHTVSVLAQKKYLEGNLTQQKTISLLQEQRLYNFIGVDEFDIEIFDQAISLRNGDIVTLMTVGVYDTLSYSHLEDLLRQGKNCSDKSKAIIEAVDRSPGEKENASVLLIAV